MTAPVFTILTQKEIVIDLSRPAMEYIIAVIEGRIAQHGPTRPDSVACEVDNFRHLLHNLHDRSEPEPETENLDLIGE